MKTFPYFILLTIMISISCRNEDKVLLCGCCENPAISATFGNALIYTPNIFTPNDDGLNDRFMIDGDSLFNIISLEIRNRKGHLVFHAENTDPYDYMLAWDGKVDGVVQKGLYSVSMIVEALDGTIGNFETKVCNYPCGLMEGEEMISIEGCRFSAEWACQGDPDCGRYGFDYYGCFK